MAPAIVIRLEFEAAPVVYPDCLNSGEEARVLTWLHQNVAYLELVDRAVELAEDSQAA